MSAIFDTIRVVFDIQKTIPFFYLIQFVCQKNVFSFLKLKQDLDKVLRSFDSIKYDMKVPSVALDISFCLKLVYS